MSNDKNTVTFLDAFDKVIDYVPSALRIINMTMAVFGIIVSSEERKVDNYAYQNK